MEGKKTRQSIVKAFNAAIEGIIYTFKKERNMKIHYCVALVILISSLYLGFSKIEMILLLFTISLVVISEMFNTAVEKTVDMITDDYHPLAKIAKDVAAGGVLIASLNAATCMSEQIPERRTGDSREMPSSERQRDKATYT
jgi:diacylglycerol kinase (ATP)